MSNRSTPTRRSTNRMSSSSRQASEGDNRIAEAMDTSESDLARPLPPSSPQVPGSGKNEIISKYQFFDTSYLSKHQFSTNFTFPKSQFSPNSQDFISNFQ